MSDFNNSWQVYLASQNFGNVPISCENCEGSVNITTYEINPATVLFVEFSVEVINQIQLHPSIIVNGVNYNLVGLVRNKNFHFTVANKIENNWVYIDDLKRSFAVILPKWVVFLLLYNANIFIYHDFYC